MGYKTTFDAEDLDGLLAQVIGAASSMRFWEGQPTIYPSGLGTFLDENARGLLRDAQAYAREKGIG